MLFVVYRYFGIGSQTKKLSDNNKGSAYILGEDDEPRVLFSVPKCNQILLTEFSSH